MLAVVCSIVLVGLHVLGRIERKKMITGKDEQQREKEGGGARQVTCIVRLLSWTDLASAA